MKRNPAKPKTPYRRRTKRASRKGHRKSTIYLLIIFFADIFHFGNATGFFLLKSAKETVYVDSNLYSYSSDVENSSAEAFGGVPSDGETSESSSDVTSAESEATVSDTVSREKFQNGFRQKLNL